MFLQYLLGSYTFIAIQVYTVEIHCAMITDVRVCTFGHTANVTGLVKMDQVAHKICQLYQVGTKYTYP